MAGEMGKKLFRTAAQKAEIGKNRSVRGINQALVPIPLTIIPLTLAFLE